MTCSSVSALQLEKVDYLFFETKSEAVINFRIRIYIIQQK